MKTTSLFAMVAVLTLVVAEVGRGDGASVLTFGELRQTSQEEVHKQAKAWLESRVKFSEADRKAFEAIWDAEERTMLEKLADTLALGSPEAAKLLKEARDESAPAPTSMPEQFENAKLPTFFRANLALLYGRELSKRRIYEEALAVLRTAKPEEVADPATYLYHRALAEHALDEKAAGMSTLWNLLDNVPDAPERYQGMATLMLYDLHNWKKRDLKAISRKMGFVERRLVLARPGETTQAVQRKIVAMLDEKIKRTEKEKDPGRPGDVLPIENFTEPLEDTDLKKLLPSPPTPGEVTKKDLQDLAGMWGKLTEKDRTRAMTMMIQGFPEEYRQVVENYFKKGLQANLGK